MKIKLLFLLLFSGSIYASSELDFKVRLDFPENISTVGEAVQYLVEPIGYEVFVSDEILGSYAISNRNLPKINNKTLPRKLDKAIAIITNSKVIIDKQNKLVSFTSEA